MHATASRGRWSWSAGLTRETTTLARYLSSESPGDGSADLAEEARERPGEGLGLLHIGQMGRRLEDDQLGALDLLVHDLGRGDRRTLVVLSDDDHGRHPDGAAPVGQVEPGDGVDRA